MYVIKGFASHNQFVSNTYGQIHPIGEISTYTLTYAKDKGLYTEDRGNISVYTFNSTKDGKYQILSQDWHDHVFSVVDFIYDYSIRANSEIYADELLRELMAHFAGKANTFRSGKIASDGNFWLPEWVSWKRETDESYIKFWFVDQAFTKQYDEFDIVVVPALPNVDDFYLPKEQILEKLKAINPVIQTERVEAAKNKLPNTRVRTNLFNWINPKDPTDKVQTQWDVIIYGIAGDNIDSIKDAIKKEILDHSKHTEAEWKKIFPDIFTRTEFIFVPQWDKYAIPNRRIVAGLYTPQARISTAYNTYLKPYTVGYPKTHVDQYACTLAFPYRSITTYVTSGNENRDNKFLLTDVFPDLLAVSSMHEDFNRQSKETREFSEKLMKMFIVTESMDEYSDIPVGFSRVKRNGKLFLVWSTQNIHFLMAAKSNFPVPND
jgi:hypothetical protein|nr:MAG TPA: structural protein [Caudoviricetes sp.]